MKRTRQPIWNALVLVLLYFLVFPMIGLAQVKPVGENLVVQSAAKVSSGEPRAAVSDNGITAVVWEQGSADEDVYLRYYDDTGASLTDPVQVNSTSALDQREPDIAVMQSKSIFAVVWESMNQVNADSGLDIVLRLFDAKGTALSDEIIVSQNTDGIQKNPRVAMNQNDGTILVVWQAEVNGVYGIYAHRFSVEGESLGSDQTVVQIDQDCTQPEIAIGPDGKTVISWEIGTDDKRAVNYIRFDQDGTAIDAAPLVASNSCMPYGHDVEMLEADQIVFVTALNGSIQCNVLSDTGDEILNTAVPGANGMNPKLAALGETDFVLTWTNSSSIISLIDYSITNSNFSSIISVNAISKFDGLSAVASNRLQENVSVVWEATNAEEPFGAIDAQLYAGDVGPIPTLVPTDTPTPVPPTATPTPLPPTPTPTPTLVPTPTPLVMKGMEIVPKTGSFSYYGGLVEKGIAQAYSALGLAANNIQLDINDNQSSDTKSVTLAQAAIGDPSYLAILGASASKNTVAIAQENQNAADPLIQYTFSSSQQLDTMSHLVKVAPLDDYQVDAMASVLSNNGLSKIFLMVENSAYGMGFEGIKEKANLTIIDELVFESGSIDTLQALNKISAAIAAGAQVGILAAYDTDARTLLQALSTQSNTDLRNFSWILSDAMTTDTVLQGLPFDKTLFYHPVIIGLTPSIADQLNTSIQFKANYQTANNNENPDWPAYYAYDTAAAFDAMVKAAPSLTRSDLWSTVPNLRFEGVTGTKWLDNKGSLQSAIYDVNYVVSGKFTIIGEERVKQPDTGSSNGSAKIAGKIIPQAGFDQLVYDNYDYQLNGDDPLIGHAAGGPDGDGNWVAQSRELDFGWVLVAYYEDAQRNLTTDGQQFGFKGGDRYILQFDLNRENLETVQSTGPIVEIEISSHYHYTDAQGNDHYSSQVLETQNVSFADWSNPGPFRFKIPVDYISLAPAGTSIQSPDNLLNWEIRLQNAAHQKLILSSVTIIAEEQTPVNDFMLY